MAVVNLDLVATSRRRLFSKLPEPEDLRTIAPRGILTFVARSAIAVQAAANETHIAITHALPDEFAYRFLSYSAYISGTTTVNDYPAWQEMRTPSGIRAQSESTDIEAWVLAGKSIFSGPGGGGAKTLGVTYWCPFPPRGVIQRPFKANQSAIILTDYVNYNAAAQPAMTIYENLAFLMYDIAQVQDWFPHYQQPVISS